MRNISITYIIGKNKRKLKSHKIKTQNNLFLIKVKYINWQYYIYYYIYYYIIFIFIILQNINNKITNIKILLRTLKKEY